MDARSSGGGRVRRDWDAVVIGAGVIGSAVAYYLARRGFRVCIAERGGVASGTSGTSAGHVSLQKRTPGPDVQQALENRRLLQELAQELPTDFEYVQAGGLILGESEPECQLLREFARRQSVNIPVEFLEAHDLQKLEPHVNRRFVAASYCPLDGYLNPMALSLALVRGALALGAELRTHTEVTGLVVDHGRVVAAETRTGLLGAGVIVYAAGVWSPALGHPVGVEIPLVPRKGQLIVTEPLPPLVHSLLSRLSEVPFAALGIAVPPELEHEVHRMNYMKQVRAGAFRGRVYVGTTSEFVGFDRSNTWDGITRLCRFATDLVPRLATAQLVRGWAGFRPRTPDGRSLVGQPVPGLFLATGHDSNGVQQAAWTGKLLAEWVDTGARPDPLASFDVSRLATFMRH